MSTKTLYFCDQCKKEVENGNLTDVKIELHPYSSYETKKFNKLCEYFAICEECTERLGFTVRTVEDTIIKVEPTTADKLYEIVSQMILENKGN